MKEGAVFFDRDGVLIETCIVGGMPVAENNPATVNFISGAIQLCQQLRDANIKTFLVTNQPDVSRGKVSAEHVNSVNSLVKLTCQLTAVTVCPHDDLDNCKCRKPKPGMILGLATQFDVDLQKSFMIGDRWRDVKAGQGAGCGTIFIDYGYEEKMDLKPTHIVSSVEEAGLLLEKYFDLKHTEEQ
jgi:D-glycero-D-manno-heptose 1,7-bisphosphate phosphatase